MEQAIIFCVSLIISALALVIFKNKSDKSFNLFLKIFTLIYCGVGFFRFFLNDAFILVINDGEFHGTRYIVTDYLQSVLRWGYYINYAVLPMAIFFNSRLFKNIASYFCLPFSILNTVFYNDFMEYFLKDVNLGLMPADWFRHAFFCAELILAISIPIMLQIRHKHYFRVTDKLEWRNFLIGLPTIILSMVPTYLPQSLIGFPSRVTSAWSNLHITWLVILFLGTWATYHLFRFKCYRTRYMLVVYLSIVLFFHYDSMYLMGFYIKRLPVQLCNIASYFFIICVPFKLKKMFQFCFIANTVGTIIALALPDFSSGGLGFWNVHFILEHSLVFAIPILCMGLRIFPRITRRSLLYTLIGFTIYFLFAFISGTILNGYASVTKERVNFFFMFDKSQAFEYFPMFSFAGETRIAFGRFEIYPILVGIIYFGFLLLCFLFYLLVKKVLYKMEDDHLQLRLSAIELYEKTTGKPSRRPKEFID